MTELGLVLLALWALEGFGWVSLRSVAISRRPWGGFSARAARRLRTTGQRGLLLPERWMPAFERYLVHPWPLALSPAGVAPADGDDRPAADDAGAAPSFGWDELPAIRATGPRLKIARLAVEAGSPRAAASFAELLERLARTAPAEREHGIRRALVRSFDVRRARRRVRILRVLLRDARLLVTATTANLLAGPLLALVLGAGRVWLSWLALHLILTTLTAVLFWRATRRMPRLASADRFQTLLMLVLYPPATARFLETVFPEAFSGLDPLAVQAVLLDRKRFAAAARDRLGTLHPTAAGDDVRDWFRGAVREQVETLIGLQGLTPEASWATARQDDGAVAYCPRCGGQYRASVTHCADCAGVPLVPHTDRADAKTPGTRPQTTAGDEPRL